MIKTWIADVKPLLENDKLATYYNTLPRWRREKAIKIKDPLTKAQSVGVWALWTQIKECFAIEDANIHNFSHSGDYVLCSVEITGNPNVKLGCDIVKMKDIDRYIDRFAKRFFGHLEYQAIYNCKTREEKRDTFYRLWALKESYVKATGLGMAIDTRSFEIKLGEPITLLKQPVEHHDNYQLLELYTYDLPYKVAVCTTDVEVDKELKLLVL